MISGLLPRRAGARGLGGRRVHASAPVLHNGEAGATSVAVSVECGEEDVLRLAINRNWGLQAGRKWIFFAAGNRAPLTSLAPYNSGLNTIQAVKTVARPLAFLSFLAMLHKSSGAEA